VPTLLFNANLSQLSLALLLCTTILFSGSGIIFAVMLPRVVNKIEWSDGSASGDKKDPNLPGSGKSPHTTEDQQGTSKPSAQEVEPPLGRHTRTKTTKTKSKSKRERREGERASMASRTPEAELIARMENPQRLAVGIRTPSTVPGEFVIPMKPEEPSPGSGRESPHDQYIEDHDQSVLELESLNPHTVDRTSQYTITQNALESPSEEKIMVALSSSQHPGHDLHWSQNPLQTIGD